MNKRRPFASPLITLGLAALLFSSLAGARAESLGNRDIAARARAAAPMAASRLVALYRGKSWIWPEGTGYFDPSGRFTAWSGTGRSATYAVGQWRVNRHGRLCMQAIWHSTAGARETSSCFVHRVQGEVIYQAKVDRGAVQEKSWYVFENAPPHADDQFAKLKQGDLVEKEFAAIRARLPHAHQPRRRKSPL